jgi:hypothetical protein
MGIEPMIFCSEDRRDIHFATRTSLPFLGIEPKTFRLQGGCTTTMLKRQGRSICKTSGLLVGLEPTIFRLRPQDQPAVEGGRDIHFATEAKHRLWGSNPRL